MLPYGVVLCLGLIHTRIFINFDTGLFHSEAQVSSKQHLKIIFMHQRKQNASYYKDKVGSVV
jgi:hypothetical protein